MCHLRTLMIISSRHFKTPLLLYRVTRLSPWNSTHCWLNRHQFELNAEPLIDDEIPMATEQPTVKMKSSMATETRTKDPEDNLLDINYDVALWSTFQNENTTLINKWGLTLPPLHWIWSVIPIRILLWWSISLFWYHQHLGSPVVDVVHTVSVCLCATWVYVDAHTLSGFDTISLIFAVSHSERVDQVLYHYFCRQGPLLYSLPIWTTAFESDLLAFYHFTHFDCWFCDHFFLLMFPKEIIQTISTSHSSWNNRSSVSLNRTNWIWSWQWTDWKTYIMVPSRRIETMLLKYTWYLTFALAAAACNAVTNREPEI